MNLTDLMAAMHRAAKERLREIGSLAIPKTPITDYVYERGYHEGVVDTIERLSEETMTATMDSAKNPADLATAESLIDPAERV